MTAATRTYYTTVRTDGYAEMAHDHDDGTTTQLVMDFDAQGDVAYSCPACGAGLTLPRMFPPERMEGMGLRQRTNPDL